MEAQNRPLNGQGSRHSSYSILAPQPWSPRRFESFRSNRDRKEEKYKTQRDTSGIALRSTVSAKRHTAASNGCIESVPAGSGAGCPEAKDKKSSTESNSSPGTLNRSTLTSRTGENYTSQSNGKDKRWIWSRPLPCDGGSGRPTGNVRLLEPLSSATPTPNCVNRITPVPGKIEQKHRSTGFANTWMNHKLLPKEETRRASNVAGVVPPFPRFSYRPMEASPAPPSENTGNANASSSSDLHDREKPTTGDNNMESSKDSTANTDSKVKQPSQRGQSTSSTPENAARNELVARTRKEGGRSASVSEAEIRKHAQKVAESRNPLVTSHNLAKMLSQKWVLEREDLASKINLYEPTVTPQLTAPGQMSPAGNDAAVIVLPNIESKEALNCAALRLRRVSQGLEREAFSSEVLKHALQYAISVLEMRFLSDEREDEPHSDVHLSLQGDNVAPEIKRWLMQTFSTTGTNGRTKRSSEKRTLRSVVHVMQAGMFVERMFRKSSAAAALSISPEIQAQLKKIDKFSFDVFELERISGGNALKFVMYELLHKYDFLAKFKISSKTLLSYCDRLQNGYRKHNNRYHNPMHAADVAQCLYHFLNESGFLNWLSDVEVLAILFAGAVHDLEHTGTTNNFHTQTRSGLALLYNDRSVLENHHASTAFSILWSDAECDILSSLSKDDYRQFRSLVIEMVLATDMSLHFGQIKNMKSSLLHPESLERSKVMSLMMHCADISHPTRPWELHHRWTARLIEEFFEQGDRERELELPISPLCDRHSTMIAQSQIGFLDYVVIPTFDVLGDVFWEVNKSVNNDSSAQTDCVTSASPTSAKRERSSSVGAEDSTGRRFSDGSPLNDDQFRRSASAKKRIKDFRKMYSTNTKQNRQKWVERDEIEREAKETELQCGNEHAHENDVKGTTST